MYPSTQKFNFYRFEGADCSGEKTLIEKNIDSQLYGGKWNIFYRGSDPEENNMCNITSMSLTDTNGNQYACCNVVQTKGRECNKKDNKDRKLAAQDKLSFGQN